MMELLEGELGITTMTRRIKQSHLSNSTLAALPSRKEANLLEPVYA
jgi:hypothetical protein